MESENNLKNTCISDESIQIDINNPNQATSPLKIVGNGIREQVIKIIYRILEKKISLGEIERQTGINKACIYKYKTRAEWPQKEARQKEILEKLTCFEISLNQEKTTKEASVPGTRPEPINNSKINEGDKSGEKN